MASRRGGGRVRRLHSQVLWVREAVARRELTIARVPGCDNPADSGTKHLALREMHECSEERWLQDRGWSFEYGVEGRKGVRRERPCFGFEDRWVDIIVRDHVVFTDGELLIGDKAKKPDSQEFGVHHFERKRASIIPESRD